VIGQTLQVLSGLVALLAGALLAVRVWTAPPRVKVPPAVYAPVTQAVKPGEVHETESPANGFILIVETVPEASELWVNGQLSGPTPASLNFDCQPGDTVQLSITHSGFTAVAHDVKCKKDVMLIVEARLGLLEKK
jgi:hypothetical protein